MSVRGRHILAAAWRWRLPASVQASPLFWIPFASLISFLLTWRLFALPMVSDEGGYAFVAERWLDGRGDLYHDLWISRPQAIFVVYGAIIEVAGGSAMDFRLVAWACNVMTMIAIWAIARRWRGPQLAAGATMVFALLMGSPAIEGFTANAEVFMAMPAAFSVVALVRAHDRNWHPGWLFATGTLIGIAAQLKPSGVIMLAVAGLFIALLHLESVRFVRDFGKVFGLAVAGFGFSLLPAIVHGVRLGWDEFFYASVTYRLTEQSTATGSLYHHANGLWDLSWRVWPIYAAVAGVVAVRYLTVRSRREMDRQPRSLGSFLRPAPQMGIVADGYFSRQADPVRLLIRLWIIGCLFGISMGGDWWNHYLIQLTAPLAIWLVASIADLRPKIRRGGQIALATVTVLMLLVPYIAAANETNNQTIDRLFAHPGYADQQAVADYIAAHTRPETPIFVAFDQAALYYLADRPSTYRYLYDQELRAFPEAQDDLIAMIESTNRPRYIIGTRQVAPFSDRGLAFWEAVQRHYVLETVIRGVPIYRAKAELPLPFVPLE